MLLRVDARAARDALPAGLDQADEAVDEDDEQAGEDQADDAGLDEVDVDPSACIEPEGAAAGPP